MSAMNNDAQGVPVKEPVSGNGKTHIKLWALKAERDFRCLLANVMKHSGKTRVQIASEMSRVLAAPPNGLLEKIFSMTACGDANKVARSDSQRRGYRRFAR